MADNLPPLPPGATLDQQIALTPVSSAALPPLPPGASLDAPSNAPPALPDTSGIQKMVQDNLAKPTEGEATTTPQPQSSAQKLDTALGMPASGLLSGKVSNDAPLPAAIRGHIMDAYANGTASDAGDYMQTALPAAAHAALDPNFMENVSRIEQRTGKILTNAAGMVAGFIPDSVARLVYTGAQSAGLAPKDVSVEDIGRMSVPSIGEAFSQLGNLVFPKGSPQNKAEEYADRAATMVATLPAAGGATLPVTTWRAVYLGAAGIFGPEAQKSASDWAKETFPNQPFIHETISQAANLATMLGIGGAGHIAEGVIPGHEALKPIVAEATGKPEENITPQDINDSITKGFTDKAPKAQDFHDVATVMKADAGVLRDVYEQTGVHPDQVFEDSKTDPALAADITAGKVPTAYDHLKEKKEEGTPAQGESQPPAGEKKPLSTEGASTSINPLSKIFNPAGMSESARDMATSIRQGRGPATNDAAMIQDTLQKYAKDFGTMNKQDRLGFIDYMENRTNGAINPFPEFQEAADKIRDIYSQMGEKLQDAFPDVGLRRDYFTHQYEDEAAAKQFFNKWVAKQGSERNIKERTFPTLAEAMESGLKPKTTNPIETVMNYVTNMGNLLAAHKTVELAKDFGVADYFAPGEQPAGWVPLNGNLSLKEGQRLYAPEDAARVYNNDISEKASGPAGDILDNVQRMNNFFSKMVLGLSGYHFTATTIASAASDVARGTLEGVGQAVSPLANVRNGSELINGYLGREELPPEIQKALDIAIKNNTINVKQQDYWKAGPAKDYVDVFKNGTAGQEFKAAGETLKEHPLTGVPRIIANELGRTMDTISKPLFDYYIPRLKISANIKELHDWIESHPDATPQEQDRAAQDIGNSIDNRFGEMMRDNLFWHQLTRQTLQTALLSYSWVAGGVRMLKGIPDTAATIVGKTGLLAPKELSSNAKYLFGMAATYVVMNGVRTYVGTGSAPDDIKDFIYPRTGGTTSEGKEERELIPSHIGQYTNYLHEGLGELGNEMSPGLKLVYHLTTNKDFRGLPITNENNSWFDEQRWGDYIKYTLGETTPIGLKTFLQGNKKGSDITTAEKVLGARQAPRFITDPEGYASMMKRLQTQQYQRKLRSDKKLAEQYEGNTEENQQ